MSTPLASEMTALPGSASGVSTYGTKFSEMAEAVTDAAHRIRHLVEGTESGQSEAVDALVSISSEVADKLEKLHTRYSIAGSALTTYSGALSGAKASANTAIANRDLAQSEYDSADWYVHHYQDLADQATDPVTKAVHLADKQRWKATRDAAETEIYNARVSYGQAVEDRDAAADVATSKISTAVESDGINDGFFEDWQDFWEEWGDTIDMIVTVIGYAAAVFAIVALFIPGLNVIVGGVIGLVMLVAVIAAGLAILNAICQASAGTKSVNEAIVDVGLALLPFGIGKIGGAFAKSVLGAAKSTAATSLVKSAAAQHKSLTNAAALLQVESVIAKTATDLAKIQKIASMALTKAGPSPALTALLGDIPQTLVLHGVLVEAGWVGADTILDGVLDATEGEQWSLEPIGTWHG